MKQKQNFSGDVLMLASNQCRKLHGKKKQKPKLEEKKNHFVESLRGVANANANKENSKHCLPGAEALLVDCR